MTILTPVMRHLLRRTFDGCDASALKYVPILYWLVKQAPTNRKREFASTSPYGYLPRQKLTHERFHRSRTCRYSTFAPYRNESVVMFDEMVWHVRNNSFVCHHHGVRRSRLPSQLLMWNSTVKREPICAAGFFDPSLRQSETLISLGLPNFNAIYVRAKRYLVTCCYSGLLQRCEPGPAIDNLCSIGARVIRW
jgi:hypothetical protein